MISYAQNLEDVVLNRVFCDVPRGFYIDLGAFDPVVDSVTKHFYDAGWSGINVEPVPRFHEKFVRERPRDINLNVAVGQSEGWADFHEYGDSGLGSIVPDGNRNLAESMGFPAGSWPTRITTLARITEQYAQREVEFLKIDVEGAERDVILGGEWHAFRPRVILLEAIRPKRPQEDPRRFEPAWFEWEGLLIEAGYEFALFDGLNRFYYRREEPDLRKALSFPANVNDGFTLWPGHALAPRTTR